MISAPFGGKGPNPDPSPLEIYCGPVQSRLKIELGIPPELVMFLYVAQVFPQPAETTIVVMDRNKIEPTKNPT